MDKRTLTNILIIAVVLGIFTIIPRLSGVHLPGNHEGYEPVQPIEFSHRLHAGELAISCYYCHGDAEESRHAGVPSADVCMNCHGFVQTSFGAFRAEDALAREEQRDPRPLISAEIQKIYDALALDETLNPDPNKTPQPIEWTKVYHLSDFVYFNHSRHVNAGVDCQTCHGPVETMERIRQVGDLSMGWCVNCHRDVNQNGLNGKPVQASTDCSACHF